MKKLLSLIITTVIILALPAFSVSAAYNAELTVSSTEAKSGENAEIVISIANNPGLCALGFEIQYDKDALTVVSAKFADLFSSASSRVNTQDGKIVFNAASADNVNGNGAVAKITFKVTASDFKGSSVEIKPLGEKGFVLHSEADHSLVDVSLKLNAGAVLSHTEVTDAPTTDIPTTDAPATDAPVTGCVHSNTVSETVKAPTCDSKGVAITRCTDCGISLGETELSPAEHKAGEWETVTEPTADKAGEAVKKCTVCGQTVETKVLDKLTAATTDNGSAAVTTNANANVGGDGNGNATVIIIVIAAIAVAGILIAFAIFKARSDKRKNEADYF